MSLIKHQNYNKGELLFSQGDLTESMVIINEGSEGFEVKQPISRDSMANYLGIAYETVSRKLSQLEDEGIIRTLNHKTILVKDLGSLTALAGKYN